MALNIPQIARQGVKIGFAIADSVLTNAVLSVRTGAGSPDAYNPLTDTVTPTVTTHNVRGFQYQSGSQKLADDSELTSSFLVSVEELDASSLTETPNPADYFTIGGVQWNITRVDPDPARAAYVFQLRKGT